MPFGLNDTHRTSAVSPFVEAARRILGRRAVRADELAVLFAMGGSGSLRMPEVAAHAELPINFAGFANPPPDTAHRDVLRDSVGKRYRKVGRCQWASLKEESVRCESPAA